MFLLSFYFFSDMAKKMKENIQTCGMNATQNATHRRQ
jgi:hypothetical protein